MPASLQIIVLSFNHLFSFLDLRRSAGTPCALGSCERNDAHTNRTQPLRSFTMMINDLSVSKELDGQAVRGGFGDTNQANFAGGAVAVTNSFGSIGTTSLAV